MSIPNLSRHHHRHRHSHCHRVERHRRADTGAETQRDPIKAGEVPQRKKIAPIPKRGTFVPPKTPWGDPDITGDYNNSDESGIPFERPDEYRRARASTPSRRPSSPRWSQQRQQQTIERTPGLSEFPGATSPMHWFENYYAVNSRPWLVTDPADGKVPPQTAEARQRQARTAGSAEGPRPGRFVGRPQPLRSLHHARHPRIDDAGHLRQLVSHPAEPGVRDDHLRDGARHARDSARLAPARRRFRSVSTSATAAATGKATRSSSRRRTSPTRRRIAARATS